jgi:flagellar L-ring protein precursor FlgH
MIDVRPSNPYAMRKDGWLRRLVEALFFVAAFFVALTLTTGCSVIEPRITMRETTAVVPKLPVQHAEVNGAIFQATNNYRALAEDRRPAFAGDILTIALNEKTSASRSSKSTTGRTADVKAQVPTVVGVPFKGLQGLNVAGGSSNTFEGKGDTANENQFTGTITVMVVERLTNGNLVVAGDKQIGINQNMETIRFSGVVDPLNIQAGNVVNSTQVAEARLEYRGKGYIDEAQRIGWLSRLFMNFLPF